MRITFPALLTVVSFLSAPVSAQLLFTDAGPLDSAGPTGDAANSTFSATNTSATPIYDTFTFTGDLTAVQTRTFANEARFNLTDSGSYSANFQPSTTPSFGGTLGIDTVTNGAFWAPAVGAFTVESFESFDDGAGVDATWNNVTFDFTGPAAAVDLGQFTLGSIFLFDTEGSGFDTELGGLTGAGVLLDSDDDGGTGLQSLLNLGVLAVGDYYLALGGFNTNFDNYVVTSGALGGDYNLNLNGISVGTGTLATNSVDLFRFGVQDAVAVVSEPGTIVLTGLGLALMAARRRRKT